MLLHGIIILKDAMLLGQVVQSVTCLAADMCLTADPGLRAQFRLGPILSWKLIMKSFLQPFSFLLLIQDGLMSVTSKSICTKYWLTA